MRLSGHQPEVDEVANGVGQRQNFGGYSPARLSDGLILSPPFAPCP